MARLPRVPRRLSEADRFPNPPQGRLRCDAPAIYKAARIDRRTYSSIISHPFRPVAKRTAIQFAIALRLDRVGADELLRSAGFALSPAIPADMVFAEAIDEGDGDLQSVSERLYEYGMKAIA